MKRAASKKSVLKPGVKRISKPKVSKPVRKRTEKKTVQKAVTDIHVPQLKNQADPGIEFDNGSPDEMNVLELIEKVRTGIPYNTFHQILNFTPFSLSEWANYLQLSERTIQRNQKENKPFQPIHSEKILELYMLYTYGVDVFGDKSNFNTWLNSKSVVLGGGYPKNLLDTTLGIGLIKDELGRIEHGVLA